MMQIQDLYQGNFRRNKKTLKKVLEIKLLCTICSGVL